ncbi:MAG: hypothetical protein ACF8R7_09745 [Phycisphaerales bacterium JB039]
MMRCRRTLLLAALLLLGGAVVNAAVAWGIRLAASQPSDQLLDGLPRWHVPLTTFMEDEPPPVIASGHMRSRWITSSIEHAGSAGCDTTAIGWPMRSALMAAYHDMATGTTQVRGAVRLWHTQDSFDLGGVFPVRPIFPGFVVNTLFYAVVVGAILALPLSFRARRGRCAKCNSDLAGPEGPCPECGAAR